jgi:hypothetical protein
LATLESQGNVADRKITRAWTLLKADATAGPAWSDEPIRLAEFELRAGDLRALYNVEGNEVVTLIV